jgi:hypothetical protein
MHSRTLVAVLIFTSAFCAACRTKNAPTRASHTLGAPSGGKVTLAPADQLRDAIAVVLEAHGFVAPIPIQAGNSTATIVSARTRPPGDLVLAVVNVTPEREVAVDLTAYAQVGSEWPLLGRLFRGPIDRETSAIRSEIQAKLKGDRKVSMRRDSE